MDQRDYQNLSQVVIKIAAAVQDVVSLLKQINISSDTWHTANDLASACLLVLSIKTNRNNFLSVDKASNILLQVYLKDILSLQLCVIA